MWETLEEVYDDIKAKLTEFGAGGERGLIIAGHSLGGVLSQQASARLAADGFNVSGTYTWAAGRAGDARFAELYRELGLQDKTLRQAQRGPAALALRSSLAVVQRPHRACSGMLTPLPLQLPQVHGAGRRHPPAAQCRANRVQPRRPPGVRQQ